MGFYYFPASYPSYYRYRSGGGSPEEPEREPGPSIRKFLIFLLFISIMLLTAWFGDIMRKHYIKEYKKHENVQRVDEQPKHAK